MALVGNGVRYGSTSPVRTASGVASVYAASVSGAITPGSRRCWWNSSATGTEADKSAIPDGYRAPGAWVLAPKPGGMSARNELLGAGTLAGNAVGGLSAVASITGAGSLVTLATGIGVCLAALAGSGSLTADSTALGHMVAAPTGLGDLAGAVLAVASGAAALVGSGDLTADAFGAAAIEADLTGSGALTGAAAGVASVIAALVGSGALSASSIGVAQATAALTGSGGLVGAMTALGHMVAGIVASSTTSADTGGTPGYMSAEVGGSGELSNRSIAEAIWNALLTDYQTAGTMGAALATAGAGGLPPEFQTILRELWALAGLDNQSPLVVTATSRKVPGSGAVIDQTITDSSGTVTVQRN